MKYYKFWQDMDVLGNWFLDEANDANGIQIYGWNFSSGIEYTESIPVSTTPYQVGNESPVSFGGLDTPYFRRDIGDVIEKIAKNQVQRFDVFIPNAVDEYCIINATITLDAIDPSSDIEKYTARQIAEVPERGDRYKMVSKIVLNGEKIPVNSHIFRLKGWLVDLIVSEDVKNGIEKICPNHGGEFILVDVVK